MTRKNGGAGLGRTDRGRGPFHAGLNRGRRGPLATGSRRAIPARVSPDGFAAASEPTAGSADQQQVPRFLLPPVLLLSSPPQDSVSQPHEGAVPRRRPVRIAAAHPTPFRTVTASLGQFSAQAPHTMQSSPRTISAVGPAVSKTP